jgi:hypothetical protein
MPKTNFQQQSKRSSLAVDENPIRELKLLRRQLNRLAIRVTTLEHTTAQQAETIGWFIFCLNFIGLFLKIKYLKN